MKTGIVLEVERSALLELIKNGSLSLNDIRCPNQESKAFLWKSYLEVAHNKVMNLKTIVGLNRQPSKEKPDLGLL